MSIELITKYGAKVDETFYAESKTALLTNNDYDWTGAHAVKVYKVSTVALNDYKRNVYSTPEGETESISRYGQLRDLSATTEELLLRKDRSFIFNVDKLDQDETGNALSAETALARQVREVVIPEVDSYTYGVMTANAGHKPTAIKLDETNIYKEILKGSKALDDAKVPDTERVLLVSSDVYVSLKLAKQFDNTDVGAEMRLLGVVGVIDGMNVIKAPSSVLPENFGFMIAHPCATVNPKKLEDYSVHSDTPLASGDIVTGRVVYDTFVLDNKTKAIYYQQVTSSNEVTSK